MEQQRLKIAYLIKLAPTMEFHLFDRLDPIDDRTLSNLPPPLYLCRVPKEPPFPGNGNLKSWCSWWEIVRKFEKIK